MAKDFSFHTRVSGHTSQGHQVRGHLLSDLVNQGDFTGSLFLSLTGKLPTESENFIFNALLTAALDHGVQPASGFVPRVVAASGNDVKTAMASTILALGELHGGAITEAMETFQELANTDTNLEVASRELVANLKTQGKRLMGYGHPVYKDEDPRTQQLYRLAREHQLSDYFINISLMLEQALEQELNRKLVLNIDGAFAALLLTLGFQPSIGNGIFALARVAGSLAHIQEELETPGVRRLPDELVEYQPE